MHLVAAGTVPPFLAETAALLVCGAGIAYLCHRLGLVPIVGFLLAGVVIGPNALGLVRDQALVDAAAEAGVILLLFTIGIEFSLDKLARIRRLIVGGGTLQVGLATLVTLGLLVALGVDWRAAVFTGFLVSLSSTALVLKLLGDAGETATEHGQVSVGLLVFQDLAIIVMVLLVPMLAGQGGGGADLAIALAKAIGIIVVVLVGAGRVMPPLLERVARTCSPELFLLTIVAICFGTAYLTSLAGVSVSLGAFLAGLVVSESPESQHAFSEILPLQILFSATFFISVGMLLDVGFLLTHLPVVLASIAVLAVVKVVTTGAAALALGYAPSVTAAAALTLAQVGEFSFVLERAGRDLGLTPAGAGVAGSQTFIAATVLLMVATPQLARLGTRLAARMEARPAAAPAGSATPAVTHAPRPVEGDPTQGHVVVAGYGSVARRLVQLLRATDVPYVVTTLDPDGAAALEDDDLPVVRGDVTRQAVIDHAGVRTAKVVAVLDDTPADTHRILSVLRSAAPGVRLLARTARQQDAADLVHAGADLVVVDEAEAVRSIMSRLSDDTPPVTFVPDPETACRHADAIQTVTPSARGCEDCLRIGARWVHLRLCLTCGHVGCCDSSPHKHATAHHHATKHPIVRSFEPGERWAWCYVHQQALQEAVRRHDGR